MPAKASNVCPIFARTLEFDKTLPLATTTKIQLRSSGIYINSGAAGKMTIAADGTGTDDITLSGTVTLDDDLITPTTKKVQFRSSGIYINSGAAGKMTIAADGAGADDITLSGTTTAADDITMATGKFLLGVADGVKAAGIIIPARTIATANIPVAATAGNWTGLFFIADAACEVVSVKERHAVAGTDGGAVSVMLKKVPSGTAKGSGTDTLTGGISLKGTADTNASGTLHGTPANYQLVAGDALGLVTTGTLTSLDGVTVTVELKRI